MKSSDSQTQVSNHCIRNLRSIIYKKLCIIQNRVMVRHVSHQGHEMNHNQMTVVARGTFLVDSVYVMHISDEQHYISYVLSLSRGVRK